MCLEEGTLANAFKKPIIDQSLKKMGKQKS